MLPFAITFITAALAFFGLTGMSLSAPAESNLIALMSAMLYLCTDEPTWKLIPLSVPLTNLPWMRLPFLSSSESAHAVHDTTTRTASNPPCKRHFHMLSPPPDQPPAFLVVHVFY